MRNLPRLLLPVTFFFAGTVLLLYPISPSLLLAFALGAVLGWGTTEIITVIRALHASAYVPIATLPSSLHLVPSHVPTQPSLRAIRFRQSLHPLVTPEEARDPIAVYPIDGDEQQPSATRIVHLDPDQDAVPFPVHENNQTTPFERRRASTEITRKNRRSSP